MNARDPRARNFGLVWGSVLAASLLSVLTVLTVPAGPKYLIAPFALALGPFIAFLEEGTDFSTLLVTVTIAAIALIPAHALRPSKWTFFLTCCGIELWIGTAWAILIMSD